MTKYVTTHPDQDEPLFTPDEVEAHPEWFNRDGDLKCPLDECSGTLTMEWYFAAVIDAGWTGGQLADPNHAHTSGWKIGCTNDHILLFPDDHSGEGMDWGEECYDCAPDEGESNTPVWHDDRERLRRLLRMS